MACLHKCQAQFAHTITKNLPTIEPPRDRLTSYTIAASIFSPPPFFYIEAFEVALNWGLASIVFVSLTNLCWILGFLAESLQLWVQLQILCKCLVK